MTLYLDSSALLKRYVAEPDSDIAEQYLLSDKVWVTARHTWVEVRRNLARLLSGRELVAAQRYFSDDFRHTNVVELDEATCVLAAQIAEVSLLRTLDALHVAALRRVGSDVPLLSFDIRQAQAARGLGITVLGA
ncbi:MAG TPA: type II toxin-antitoxin system VapC family toxin [Polyangiaceae bacterium]|nr:type II toxin-antitoxin system VapC family toxin [Polyangiaceae bacterium]